MTSASLDALLERLSSGDHAAAEQVFLAFEPYLRMVVRRQLPTNLRARFDSTDIVQSVWADVLSGFREAGWRFKNVQHLRSFLIRVTRNRFISRARQHDRSRKYEQESARTRAQTLPSAHPPSASEVAQANELWERLLDLCPAEHRPILQLKRQGVSLAQIAEQTGLHPSSVRRILYNLERRLATA